MTRNTKVLKSIELFIALSAYTLERVSLPVI